ncbi:MAG: hypothetical protein CME05_14085 [Gemmatimonadaceae bacterium]|nr:hypothetical protein [Gemmatimonadaceae bacterium]
MLPRRGTRNRRLAALLMRAHHLTNQTQRVPHRCAERSSDSATNAGQFQIGTGDGQFIPTGSHERVVISPNGLRRDRQR